jgi:translation elongation factor EF-4
VFDSIIDRIDPPKTMESDDALKMFLFDARFVKDKGVACFVKVMSGRSLDFEKIK